jgi:hypothetical protein
LAKPTSSFAKSSPKTKLKEVHNEAPHFRSTREASGQRPPSGGRQGNTGRDRLFPIVKLFNPCGAATWLLTEIDPDDDTVAWGLCDLGMGFPEFGTVNLSELAEYRGRLGLGIERDLHFEARGPISAYIEAARKAGGIVETIGAPEDMKGGAA